MTMLKLSLDIQLKLPLLLPLGTGTVFQAPDSNVNGTQPY